MNKAEAKATVTIPMKGRYFLHKNGSIIPVTDIINAIYLMTGNEKINEWDPDIEAYIRYFFGNIVREMSPTEITVPNFLKHGEKIKAIRLYYHMHNTESQKCTLVEAKDYVEQLKTKMKERGEL
jgi:hypothetical protein